MTQQIIFLTTVVNKTFCRRYFRPKKSYKIEFGTKLQDSFNIVDNAYNTLISLVIKCVFVIAVGQV